MLKLSTPISEWTGLEALQLYSAIDCLKCGLNWSVIEPSNPLLSFVSTDSLRRAHCSAAYKRRRYVIPFLSRLSEKATVLRSNQPVLVHNCFMQVFQLYHPGLTIQRSAVFTRTSPKNMVLEKADLPSRCHRSMLITNDQSHKSGWAHKRRMPI